MTADVETGTRRSTRARRARRPADEAVIEGRPALALRDEDRVAVASAQADVLLARALAGEAQEVAS